jgi:hypothetical protein
MVKPAFGSSQRHDRLAPLTRTLLGAALPPDSLARVLIEQTFARYAGNLKSIVLSTSKPASGVS